ncbi:MAG: DUF1214 domain-containing protein [Thermoanaerobaculia bacterium]
MHILLRSSLSLLAVAAWLSSPALAQPAVAAPTPAADLGVPVTVDNFVRAETDLHFARTVQSGAFGKLVHARTLAAIAKQVVQRLNRDTLESSGVFDLAAAPVTVTLPDPAGRYMAMQAVSQDHFTIEVADAPGTFTYTQEKVGTRYLFLLVRTLPASERSLDLKAANALQDKILVTQELVGRFEVPRWNLASLDEVRGLLEKRGTPAGAGEMFGSRAEVDPERHLVGTAIEWGGLPRRAAIRDNIFPPVSDGQSLHTLTVRDVPIDGFWSINVYDAKGYFARNDLGFYTFTSASAQPNRDGSYTMQFGGCRRGGNNCLPITPGWSYTVRLYRPRQEVLDGSWKFPVAKAVLPPQP